MVLEQNSMNDQQKQNSVQGRVILELPQSHVKTVKSALEKSGQLDRTNKITLAASKAPISTTKGTPGHNIGVTRDETVSESSGGNVATPIPAASPGDRELSYPFPVLKFDLVSGQYVDPAALGQEARSGPSIQSPVLTFDEVTGQYVDPALFPGQGLKFDAGSGRYVAPTVLEPDAQSIGAVEEQRMRISTTIPYSSEGVAVDDNDELKSRILEALGLSYLSRDISIVHQPGPNSSSASMLDKNPLRRALSEALGALTQTYLAARGLTVEVLVSSFPDSYSVYKPMLLLPHNAFASQAWNTLLSTQPQESGSLESIWKRMAEGVGATHVAINSPIPLQTSAEPAVNRQSPSQENILRSPVNLTPIYGDFGPSPTRQTLSFPTEDDFEGALWVTTIQNGIHQTWAPRYTMFSRGVSTKHLEIHMSPKLTPYPQCRTSPRKPDSSTSLL